MNLKGIFIIYLVFPIPLIKIGHFSLLFDPDLTQTALRRKMSPLVVSRLIGFPPPLLSSVLIEFPPTLLIFLSPVLKSKSEYMVPEMLLSFRFALRCWGTVKSI
jgi:hypothetical protein